MKREDIIKVLRTPGSFSDRYLREVLDEAIVMLERDVKPSLNVPHLEKAKNIPGVIYGLWAIDGCDIHAIEYRLGRPSLGSWIATLANTEQALYIADRHNREVLNAHGKL